jgi:hypothetical protein
MKWNELLFELLILKTDNKSEFGIKSPLGILEEKTVKQN